MTNNQDDYVDFTNTASLKTTPEPLYGNTQEQQVLYGNIDGNGDIGANEDEQPEEHYASYHKDIEKDEDADDYMDLVTTNNTTKHSNKTNNAMEENHYGNIITEDPLYGNLTPKPSGYMK